MEIRPLPVPEVLARVDQIAAVYRAAFAPPPYNRQEREVADLAQALPVQAEREGFRCFVALDEQAHSMVGFAYGYRSLPGQWWYESVSRALGERAARDWLADAYQVTEIAVIPAYQGRGIGGALHDCLLQDIRSARAVLSTLDAETAGRAMYRSRGWQDLLDGFYFPGVGRRYAIMGRVLRAD